MERNIFQDVVPPEKRSIRDIPIPGERRKKPTSDGVRSYESEPPQNHSFEEKQIAEVEQPPRRKRSRWLLWLSILIAVLVLLFAFSVAFGNATVFVTPKTLSVPLNANFKAEKSATSTTSTSLNYDVITFTKTGSKVIPAGAERAVDTKASGKIIIYSNETKPQTLIKNTRFETSEGLIYRIPDAVSVPAKSGTTPGSLEVMVYADAIGAKYNIGLSDFTIPGFKGDPKFKTMYARSKTSMTGGSSGLVKTASEADLSQAIKDIQANLRKELIAQARTEMPDNFILFDAAASIEFESLSNDVLVDNTVRVNQRADFTGIIFNKTALKTSVAKEVIPDYDNSAIEIPNLEELVFSPLSSGDITAKSEFIFNLKGNPNFVWTFDELELKNMIAGKSLDEIQELLRTRSALAKTEIVIKPFWEKTLPGNPSKIKIIKKDI